MQSRLSAPIVCSIEITANCNLQCVHCFASSPNEHYLPTYIVQDIIDQVKALGVFVLDIGGGEPFLHKGIIPIVKTIHESGLDLSLTSNGTMITKSLAAKLSGIGITDQIQISIHGFQKVHDSITGINGSFHATKKGLINLLKAGIKPSIGIVFLNSNKSQLPDLIKQFQKLGVPNFHIMSLIPMGRGRRIFDRERPSINDWNAMLQEINHINTSTGKIQIAAGNFNYLFHSLKIPKKLMRFFLGDQAGRLHILIASNGNVYPSEELRYEKFLSGNIKDNRLNFIWKNSLIFDKLQSIVGGLNLKGKCKTCLDLEICRGGSRGFAWGIKKDLRASDPLCPKVSIKQRQK